MNTTPIYVFATYLVKAGKLDTVLTHLKEMTQKSEAEAGNLFYKVHQSTTNANKIVLFEGYANESALNEHRNSEHFQTLVVGKIIPLLESREVVLTNALV